MHSTGIKFVHHDWNFTEFVPEAHNYLYLDSKVHGANMGPIWGRQDPSGPREHCYLGKSSLVQVMDPSWMGDRLLPQSMLSSMKHLYITKS